jgi:hypothetical protein
MTNSVVKPAPTIAAHQAYLLHAQAELVTHRFHVVPPNHKPLRPRLRACSLYFRVRQREQRNKEYDYGKE